VCRALWQGQTVSAPNQAIEKLTEAELLTFEARTPRSLEHARRAIEVMPLAVPSNVCALAPYPIVMSRGAGSLLYDIDGHEYRDYHNGFGTTVFSHAHPAIVSAIEHQLRRGSHYGAMTEAVTPWAEHLCARFGLDWIRFSNSGTEATMDAIRLARAVTGRTTVIKIEGGYHGSHEVALVSPNLPLDEQAGPDDQPRSRPFGEGLSPRVLDEVIVVPFNNLDAAERALRADKVAALIVEPILFNVGTIFPIHGYLAGLRRLCDEMGTRLIFDETKTGATIAWGGAEELFGVQPHMKTLGKGIGGGLPVGALGDTDGAGYELIEQWRVPHLGTFSGNPLTAVAGLAALEEVLTPEAYRGLGEHYRYLEERLSAIIDTYALPAYITGAGAKGCIVWAPGEPLQDYRDYQRRFNFNLAYLGWVFFVNRGIFLAPGQDEQWTHSVAHTRTDADAFAAVFEQFAQLLASNGWATAPTAAS
jgi:glutamate-1-semialdehyde 2,1-aminomutase